MSITDEAALDRFDTLLARYAPGIGPQINTDQDLQPSQSQAISTGQGGYLTSPFDQSFDPLQLLIFNELRALRAQNKEQQVLLDTCAQKLAEQQTQLETQEAAIQARQQPDLPWYRKTVKELGRFKPEGLALSRLRNLVIRVVNEALWIRPLADDDADADADSNDGPAHEEDEPQTRQAAAARLEERATWVKLPRPGAVRKMGDTASWPCDLTAKFNAGANAALMTHVVATVLSGLDDELINSSAIPDCPEITTSAIEHAYKKRFEQLVVLYKVQTQAPAAAKNVLKQHNARVLSSKQQKFQTRHKAAIQFKRLHKGLDPSPALHPDWMSGEESAGEDGDLKKQYFDTAKISEESRMAPKPPKVVATQQLPWREDWHTNLLHRLDVYHQTYTPKSVRVHTRIAGGSKIEKLPKNRPPPCIIKKSWANSTSGKVQLANGWEKKVNPQGWEMLRDEVLSWPSAPGPP